MPALLNLVQQRFGRLTVLFRHPEMTSNGQSQWNCLCDPEHDGCGSSVTVRVGDLRSGRTRSCGCLRRDSFNKVITKHGSCELPEYGIWRAIKNRCHNRRASDYERYGGRGIAVCEEWRNSFEVFYADMGPRPSDQHSIEREENDLGYGRDNCRWATKIEQANNKRNNLRYEFDGETKTLAEWCRELNLNYKMTRQRIRKGMSFEDAADRVIEQTSRRSDE